MLEYEGNELIMKELFISFITLFVISLAVYFNNVDKDDSVKPISMNSATITSKFNSGISIKGVGELIIIEQKPHDATIIIDKKDLEDFIVFLNNTNNLE